MGDVQSITLPAPAGGLNEYDAVDQMPPFDALELRNLFPVGTNVKLRGGITSFCDTSNSSSQIRALYGLRLVDGTKKLVASVNNKIYETSTGTASNLTGALAITNSDFNGFSFRNRLFLANGTNTPIVYDGTAAANTGFTHASLTQSDLISFGSYKNWMYGIKKNSFKIYYAAVDAVTGATTEYDMQSIFKLGGFLALGASWTYQPAILSSEICMFISSEGEVVAYSGNTPADWSMIARFVTGRPMGYRSLVQLENDLLLITDQGIISLVELFSTASTLSSERIGQKINKRIRQAAAISGFDHRWHGKYWPNGTAAYINIPNGADNYYLVLNILTGAWCEYRFNTLKLASCLEVLDAQPYCGDGAGVVRKFEVASSDDSGIPISISWRSSWNFLESRGNFKVMSDARPLIYGPAIFKIYQGVDTDFKTGSIMSSITLTALSSGSSSSTPWGSSWGSSWSAGSQYYTKRVGLTGQGHSISYKLSGDFSNTDLEINAVDLRYEIGSMV